MLSKIFILTTTLLILGGVNFSIYQKEQLLKNGTPLLLELAPVDPRSLMQGDYMALRYQIAEEIKPQLKRLDIRRGHLIVAIDKNQVAHFKDIYDGKMELRPEEHLLYFRTRPEGIYLGAESFFFQEGLASNYQIASYGELRLAPSGESILVGLRDKKFKSLGP